MDIQERFSVVLKVSKVVKWSCIFVHSIRGLPNFLAIPIMNPLTQVHETRVHDNALQLLQQKTLRLLPYCISTFCCSK